jgi:hypothetical protein
MNDRRSTMKNLGLAAVLLALCTSCGGDSDTSASEDRAAGAPTPEKHLLSNEQEALEYARGVEDILAQDAEEKKKAISDAD